MLEILIIIQFVIICFFGIGYVLMGKNALIWIKLKLSRQKGAWYISHYDSKRVLINYGKYVRKHVWPKKEGESDQFETKIKQTLNQEQDTGEPIIFLQEGLGENIDPFLQYNPTEGEKSIQTNYRLAFNEGLATARKEMEKKDDSKNIIIILLGIILLASLGALAFSFLNNGVLNELISNINNYKPAIDQAIQEGVIITTGGGN